MAQVITKKDLEHKLHIQHKNDRYDAIEIINEYQLEVSNHNEELWRKCIHSPIFDPGGGMIKSGYVDRDKYDYNKKKFDPNELIRRIMNMKQRKPKEGE